MYAIGNNTYCICYYCHIFLIGSVIKICYGVSLYILVGHIHFYFV